MVTALDDKQSIINTFRYQVNSDQIEDPLTDLLKTGARQLIRQVVGTELQVLLGKHQSCQAEDDKAAVVRNNYHPERDIQAGIDPVTVKYPKSATGRVNLLSSTQPLVPPYIRKTLTLEGCYLKDASIGRMGEALGILIGKDG